MWGGGEMARKTITLHKDLNINKGENQIVCRDLRALSKLYLIKLSSPAQ